MSQSNFNKHFGIIIIMILIFSSNTKLSFGQTKQERQFSFCYQTSDTIQVTDLESCVELVPSDKNLKVKSYVVMIRLGDVFQEFDPNKGAYLVPGITDEIVKQKKKVKYIQIRDIICTEGKSKEEKKFREFRIYVKQPV